MHMFYAAPAHTRTTAMSSECPKWVLIGFDAAFRQDFGHSRYISLVGFVVQCTKKAFPPRRPALPPQGGSQRGLAAHCQPRRRGPHCGSPHPVGLPGGAGVLWQQPSGTGRGQTGRSAVGLGNWKRLGRPTGHRPRGPWVGLMHIGREEVVQTIDTRDDKIMRSGCGDQLPERMHCVARRFSSRVRGSGLIELSEYKALHACFKAQA